MPNISSILSIAVSGLNAAAARVSNAASNIVNASSESPYPATPAQYTGFVPQDIVDVTQDTTAGQSLGVNAQSAPRNPAYQAAFDPNSQQANANGVVAAPNVDIASELVTTLAASTNYGASAKVIGVVQKMEKALLDIKT